MKRKDLNFTFELKLPLDMATETLAFLGRKGRGKTYGAQRYFELLFHAGVQCVALDPVGNWWALRVGKNGKGPGLPVYVFGGPHGDVPILPDAGAYIARVIVEKRISVILDVSRFRKAERKRFMTAFAEEFFHLKKDATSPVHLFVEEAHKFVPQLVRDGEEQMLGAMEDIIRIGRNYGIGASLISQRSASVNKDVLSQVECLVAYQTGGRQDKKAIVDWVEENDEEGVALLSELKSLQRGEALLWSPAALRVFKKVHVTEKETYDASSTPKIGGRKRKPVKLAHVDLKGITEAMQKVVSDAEANDVGALKKKVAEQSKFIKALEQRLIDLGKEKGIKTMGKTKTVKVHVPLITKAQIKHLEKLTNRLDKDTKSLADIQAWMDKARDRLAQAQQAVVSEVDNLRREIQMQAQKIEGKNLPARIDPPVITEMKGMNKPLTKAQATSLVAIGAQKHPYPKKLLTPRPAAKPPVDIGDVKIDGPMMRVLSSIAWFEAIGVEQPTSVAVAFMSNYSGDNGSFRNVRGALRAAGLVDYPKTGHVCLTDKGRAVAPPCDVPASGEGLREAVLKVLDGPQQRMMVPLIEAYPNTMTSLDLAVASGYESDNGSFRNVRGRLHTYGLVDYPSKGNVQAASLLFP